MAIKILSAHEEDIPEILELMRAFAEFEKLSEFCTVDEPRLREAMFGDKGFVEGLVARDNGRAVGYALFYPNFSSFRGQRGFYLEDIYVSPAYQGKRIGEAMLKAIAASARSRGFERIDFQVLDWNTSAIGFYVKLGAVRDDSERHFKFTDAAFDSLAS